MLAFVCPMHPQVREASALPCPKCGMRLIVEGERFPLLKHMASRPLHFAIMVAVMIALMAAVMLLVR